MTHVWCLIEETAYEGDALMGVYATLEAAKAGAAARGLTPPSGWVDDGEGGLVDPAASIGGDAIRRWGVEL